MQLAPPEKVTQTYTDLDITLECGRTFTPTLLQGRDGFVETDHSLSVTFRDDAGQVVETVRIQQSSIAMLSIRTRTVEVEAPSHEHAPDALA